MYDQACRGSVTLVLSRHPMTSEQPDDRPSRRREYSGPGSTLGLAALIICTVAVGIWYFEFRDEAGPSSPADSSGLGIVPLPESLNPTDDAPAARKGRAAPNFTLADLEGEPVSLASFRGKFVLVNFWASWCGPCREETPDLQSLYEHNSNVGLVILGVNQQEQPNTVRGFAQEFGVSYPVLLDRSGEVSGAYGVGRGMPITFFVAPDGVIEDVFFGRLSEERLADIQSRLQ